MDNKLLDIIENPEFYSIAEIKSTIMRLESMISILEDELDRTGMLSRR